MSFIANLRAKFYADPVTKKKCCEASQKLLKEKIATRVFDEFPALLPPLQFSEFSGKFKAFLEQAHSGKHGYREAIWRFENDLIKIGCDELLDSSGHIKQELIDLLVWGKYVDVLDSRDIVSAYVGAVNMQIIKNLSEFIEKHSDAFSNICQFVNTNYREWVAATLKDKREDSSLLIDLIYSPQKHPAEVIGLAAGVIGVLVWAGISLFNNYMQNSAAKDSTEAKSSNFKP